MKGIKILTFLAYMAAIPFMIMFFLMLIPLGIQHVIQHWRGKKSWIDDWNEDDIGDFDYV